MRCPINPQREKAVQAARAGAPPGPRRVFVGKKPRPRGNSVAGGANGKPRLTLSVEADGTASIDFLDSEGKAVRRLTPQ